MNWNDKLLDCLNSGYSKLGEIGLKTGHLYILYINEGILGLLTTFRGINHLIGELYKLSKEYFLVEKSLLMFC